MTGFVKSYDTRSEDYQHAFQVFLAHTDEKARIHEWLAGLVQRLPGRQVFIDAGAGNGKLTARLQGNFQRTLAIEISSWLREELAAACPTAEIIPLAILEATPAAPGDLVLCSHVLYYIPEKMWPAHLDRMAGWLSPQGVLAVLLQSADCACTRLLEHFSGHRPDLLPHAADFRRRHAGRFIVEHERVAASVETGDLESACTIAEFMLNLYPIAGPNPRADVAAYLNCHARSGAGYRLSLDQDFLTIRQAG